MMNRPVIFLDFDGVLNTEQYHATLAIEGKPAKDVWGALFDPRAVKNLSHILASTNAVIVISSSWRSIYSLDRLRVMWTERGLPGEILDAIPCGTYYISRGEEIESWLIRNERPDYVILDDVDDFLPDQRNCYVEINPIIGITESDAQKAIDILIKSRTERRRKQREEISKSERAKQLCQAFQEMRQESMAKMQKRHAFLSEIVKGYSNLEDFARDKTEFFEMMGVEFDAGDNCISLYFQLDFNEYEQYFVVPTADRRLAVSHVVWWQNEKCANEILDIFTDETYSDTDVIYTIY